MTLKNNPFLNRSKHKHGAIPFDEIKQEHFLPALDYAIETAKNKLEEIKKNPETPTFENTVLSMETCDELIETVSHTYFNLMSAESDNKFKELAQEISPKLSAFENDIYLDSELFRNSVLFW